MCVPMSRQVTVALGIGLVVLAACTTAMPAVDTSWELPPGFAAGIYLPPSPTLAAGGALLGGCPNSQGLERVESISADDALALLNDFWSGDTERARRSTDPGMWSILGDIQPRASRVTEDWLDGEGTPASQSPYAGALARQCGEALLGVSWTLRVCPGPCSASASASLREDFFLLSRADQILIWAWWP